MIPESFSPSKKQRPAGGGMFLMIVARFLRTDCVTNRRMETLSAQRRSKRQSSGFRTRLPSRATASHRHLRLVSANRTRARGFESGWGASRDLSGRIFIERETGRWMNPRWLCWFIRTGWAEAAIGPRHPAARNREQRARRRSPT